MNQFTSVETHGVCLGWYEIRIDLICTTILRPSRTYPGIDDNKNESDRGNVGAASLASLRALFD